MANLKEKWVRLLSAGEELPAAPKKRKSVPFTGQQQQLDEWLRWLRGEVEVYADRKRRYKEYERMDDKSLEASAALSMYASDATALDWNMNTNVWIESPHRDIKNEGEALFNALDMPNLVWAITRNLCKYGDSFERLIFARDKQGQAYIGSGNTTGIIQTRWANPKYIERIEDEYAKLKGFLDADPWYHRVIRKMIKRKELDHRFMDARVSQRRDPWDFVQFRLRGKGRDMKYGTAMIEDVRSIWKYIDLVTEVIMVTRLSRAPSRKVFYVDVGDRTTEEEAWETLRYWKQMMKRGHWINPETGEFKSIHDPRSPSEDLYWPVRGQKSSSRIEELPGLTDVREMADVDLLWTRLFSGLKIPPSFFGYTFGAGAATTPPNLARSLTMQDMRYARTIKTVQVGVIRGLHRMLDVHFSLLGWKEDKFKGNYNVMLSAVNTDEEYQRNEIISSKLSQAAQWGYLSDRLGANREAVLKYVLAKVLNLTKPDVRSMLKQPPQPAAPQQPGAEQQPGAVQQPGAEQPPGAAGPAGYPESSENASFLRLLETASKDNVALKELVKEMTRQTDNRYVQVHDDDPLPTTGEDEDDVEGD